MHKFMHDAFQRFCGYLDITDFVNEIILILSIKQIDEYHISQDQSQKLNLLRDPLPEDRFIHLFKTKNYYFKAKKIK